MPFRTATALFLCALALSGSAGHAQSPGPVAHPLARTVPEAADTPWPGTITLDVDATDTRRGLYRVTETIPVPPGQTRLTLLLPEWHPGKHGPRGAVAELVDLTFTAADKPLRWSRDPVEVFAFHVDLPPGTAEVTARFIHTSPLQPSEGRVTMGPALLNLQWNLMSLYPAGHYVRQIRVRPSLALPKGWTAFTALDRADEPAATAGTRTVWAETDYETLVDSPVFAGLNAARFDLGHGIALDALADDPANLALPPQGLAAYRALAGEALALFGAAPFPRYEALLALTDSIGDIGLEHRRSSENVMNPKALVAWEAMAWDRNVIAHELTHAWNGKYRIPAGLWTPDYRTQMQDNLLWVYEGQTQFWGLVLAARSGLQPKDMVLGMLATTAGTLASQPGRSWRSVEDTTFDPVIAARKPKPYASMARGEDYYGEGALVWLEADQIIRAGTRGKRGLDDFARGFFAPTGENPPQSTYTFADVVTALNAVFPHDWAGFFQRRIELPGQEAPLAGIERAGYRLVWRDEPNPYERGRMANSHNLVLTHSLGLTLDKDGRVTATQWGGPAFNAGIVNGARVTGVNGNTYTPEALRAAILAARNGGPAIQLLVQRADRFESVGLDWRGGLRYPWLEKKARVAGLDLLFAPRRSVP